MQIINYTLADLQALSPTIVDRFWKGVDKNGPVPQHCPELGCCWPWMLCKNDKGYGQLFVTKNPDHQRLIYAHRLAYIIAFGIVPVGMMVLHKCDNPSCCNTAHHFPGTLQENSRDMALKGRSGQIKYPMNSVETIRDHPELSCKKLAEMLGISASQVWNIRTHRHRPVKGGEAIAPPPKQVELL